MYRQQLHPKYSQDSDVQSDRQQKSIVEGQSSLQELEAGLGSGTYLLVIVKDKTFVIVNKFE